MCAKEQEALKFPIQLVKNTNGLSFDMGGSVLKICCFSKDETSSNSATNGVGYLRFVSFESNKLHEALEFIKQNANITRKVTSEIPEIYTTGIGCTVFGKTICSTLNIKIKIVLELDCIVKAFNFCASHLCRREMLQELDEGAIKDGEEEMIEILITIVKEDICKGYHLDRSSVLPVVTDGLLSNKALVDCEKIYPCLLVTCGSSITHTLIREDLSATLLDFNDDGGKTFQGIGSLLTGYKNFDELLDLASRGDRRNIDLYWNDLGLQEGSNSDDNSVYKDLGRDMKPVILFNFGKVVNKDADDFRCEDLARAWLELMIQNSIHCVSLLAQVYDIRRVFFNGSFCNSSLVRSLLARELAKKRKFWSCSPSKRRGEIQFDFIKSGGHLGALGALISQLEATTIDVLPDQKEH